ncbi:metallophosphoesterase [Candidatus Micrarchaeota archaeon]|nr:metallophosphoesterase [Candidatus Micrarchaeota archaeon]
MRIGIIADNHLGYPRFESDSYAQAERAFLGAAGRCDLIIAAGDIFDARVPKLETLGKALEMFRSIMKKGVPVFAIYGNHERRTKEMMNPVELLLSADAIRYLHGKGEVFEKHGEKVQIFGIGNIPDMYAKSAITKALERFVPEQGAFKILVIHQTISEILKTEEDELSLDFLEDLPFDLIINGHIHKRMEKLAGKVLIPGSTVVTQLKKEETEPRGYYVYDTHARKAEFVPIECRKFFHEEINFENASEEDVRKRVREKIDALRSGNPNAIVFIKLKGTLREGLLSSDIAMREKDDIYIVNELNAADIKSKLDKIRKFREEKLSVREIAVAELEKRLDGKITMFTPSEFFDKLVEGADEALEYLEKKRG